MQDLNYVILQLNKSSVYSNENAKQIWIDFPYEFASNYIIQSACVFCLSLWHTFITVCTSFSITLLFIFLSFGN